MEANEKQSRGEFKIKPYTQLQLSRIYGICNCTMGTWLKRIKDKVGKKEGHYYSVRQVEIILKEYGLPKTIQME